MDTSKFFVIAVISNPVRYRSRYSLYQRFIEKMKCQGVTVLTVEIAFGNRPFIVTHPDANSLQLRSVQEIWHKENMINLGIQKLTQVHPEWEYLCWCDADIEFMNPQWVEETIHALQHHAVVQPWQTAIDLGPCGEALQIHQSFGWCVMNGKAVSVNWKPYSIYPHTGFAWAATRKALEGMGLLYDKGVLGAGDHHMAWSMIGKGRATLPGGAHPNYVADVLAWQNRALYTVKQNVGFVPGTIHHYWHGRKKDRRYVDRWKILVEHKFDPVNDLYRDSHGLLCLADDGSERLIKLRDAIRQYFRGRLEDSQDLE